MTVNESLVTEIEEAVVQSIEDEKGFEDAEKETQKETAFSKEEVKDGEVKEQEDDGEQKEVKEVTEEINGDGEEVADDGNEEGEGEETESVQATSNLEKLPTISEGVLGLAVQAGFSITEANSFGSEDTLLKVIQMVTDKNEPAKEKDKEQQTPFLSDLPELNPEQYEPEAIETFNKMRDAIQQQQETIDKLVQGTQQFQENQAAQNEREAESWFDQKIAGLGKNYEKTLGQGSYGDLNQGSSQLAKRDEIVDHISLMAAGYESTGRKSPSFDVLFDQATKFVLQDDMSKVKEKQLSDRLRKRATQHIARGDTEKLGSLETEEASDAELAGKIQKQFFNGQ